LDKTASAERRVSEKRFASRGQVFPKHTPPRRGSFDQKCLVIPVYFASRRLESIEFFQTFENSLENNPYRI